MSSTARKLFILGLDGLSYPLIKRWVESGSLPAMKRMRDEGVFGMLESTVPAATSPALPSLYTGKNPAKHGIFGFLNAGDRVNRFTYLQDKTLWNILSEKGVKVCIANLRTTYPPDKVNGIMISGGLFTPSERSNYVYPESLKEEIAGFHERPQILHLTKSRRKLLRNQETVAKLLLGHARKQFNLFNKVYRKDDFDFTIYWMGVTDSIQHWCWGNEPLMLRCFREVDEMVSSLLRDNRDANFLVVSDHGFEEAPTRVFHVNTWLWREGYLFLRGGALGAMLLPLFHQLLSLMPRRQLQRLFNFSAKSDLNGDGGGKRPQGLPDHKGLLGLDLEKTVAYLHQKWGIGIIRENLSDKSYEELREELIAKLLKLEVDGRRVVKNAWRREELFSGKYLDRTPDIVFLTAEGFDTEYAVLPSVFKGKKPRYAGYHDTSREGVIMGLGPDIKHVELKDASILDIAPTVLHYFGLPVDKSMDGRVLKELFREGSEACARRVRYAEYELRASEAAEP